METPENETPSQPISCVTTGPVYSSTGNSAQIGKRKNLMAVTIKMLYDASRSAGQNMNLIVNNTTVETIRVCGRLQHVDQYEKYTTFIIDDGTGSILAKTWPFPGTGRSELTGSMLGDYYEISANVYVHDVGISLLSQRARKILDHNEITLHFLTVINHHIELAKRSISSANLSPLAESSRAAADNIAIEAIIEELAQPEIRDSLYGATIPELAKNIDTSEHSITKYINQMLDAGSVYETEKDHYKLATD